MVIGSKINSGILGHNNIGSYGWTSATTIASSAPLTFGTAGYSDPNTELRKELQALKDLFFMKVVVPCEHCGQYGAAGCACKHCGAPIGYTKPKTPKEELNFVIDQEIRRIQNGM